jgi:hypothetical protein
MPSSANPAASALDQLIGAQIVRVYYFELPYDRTEGIAPARPYFHTDRRGVHSVDHCVSLLTNRGLFELDWESNGDRYAVRCRLNAPPGVYQEFAEIWDVSAEEPWKDLAGRTVSAAELVRADTVALRFEGGKNIFISAAELDEDDHRVVHNGVDNLLVSESEL